MLSEKGAQLTLGFRRDRGVSGCCDLDGIASADHVLSDDHELANSGGCQIIVKIWHFLYALRAISDADGGTGPCALPWCMFDCAPDRLAPAMACRTIQSCAPLGYRRLD